jgi:hypothetical protein
LANDRLLKEEHINRLDNRRASMLAVAIPANRLETAGQFVVGQSRQN